MSAPPINIPKADDVAVDQTSDLSPTSPVDRMRMDSLLAKRADAEELKNKGILKGEPGDRLAGKRAELAKSMNKDRLDKDIAHRPTADELVQKGILKADAVPNNA